MTLDVTKASTAELTEALEQYPASEYPELHQEINDELDARQGGFVASGEAGRRFLAAWPRKKRILIVVAALMPVALILGVYIGGQDWHTMLLVCGAVVGFSMYEIAKTEYALGRPEILQRLEGDCTSLELEKALRLPWLVRLLMVVGVAGVALYYIQIS